jgi:RimJ/RimL family protein N-acetyltransferase
VSLIYGQDERVSRWVAAQSGEPAPPVVSAIGWERNAQLVAGIYFDVMSSNNVFAHIASTGHLIPVELLAAAMAYAFRQLEVDRVTFMVEDDNVRCLRFIESMGAVPEGRLQRARKGGDILLYVLWKDNRFWTRLCDTGRS